ncbi:GNAT family N-acetyltransferase [Clostridium sardiniense]|uniref:GNAT family N-acetyltransferase n=1 Tax=Clostridium sardiniense TaxID=29369 RepID=A0ABS7KUK1_CLOSR|nr:GNAT family N-acetyltransferase [Clostridium sardiniense]MBY0754332.1 GNAT family N-acetyltransferase [Clostridium sardiniense]MDQ0461064.1 ribosomal protein S18 acetylase RimI-like enzyme [Clostridium sardiniense]
MKILINLERKDGLNIIAEIKELDETYIHKIMTLQNNIIENIDNKELYALTSENEFREIINGKGKVIGCLTKNEELIALGVYGNFKYDKNNYGHDIDIKGEKLLTIGQIESIIVSEEYRGNRLQEKLCKILEEIGKLNKTSIMCATVSPNNHFSLKNFLLLGYEVQKEKLKYGGMRRYILVKQL